MDEQRRIPVVTYALIAINVAAFAFELACGADAIHPTAAALVDVGGNLPVMTLHGEPWRMVSSMFLHAGLLHLAMNMLCLYQGRIVERLYGRLPFLAIYVVAGLGGAIASVSRGGNIVSVGASGAVFGVFAAFGVVLVLHRYMFDDEVVRSSGRRLVSFFAINLIYGFSQPGIDMSAHIGGILAGAGAAAALTLGASEGTRRVARAIAVLAAGLALTAGAIAVLPAPTDYVAPLHEFDAVTKVTLARYNDLVHQVQAHTLSADDFATAIETELLPPWRVLRAHQDAITDPPPHLARMYAASRAYVDARLTAWEKRAAALRQVDPAARASQLGEAHDDDAKAVAAYDALKQELAALDHR